MPVTPGSLPLASNTSCRRTLWCRTREASRSKKKKTLLTVSEFHFFFTDRRRQIDCFSIVDVQLWRIYATYILNN